MAIGSLEAAGSEPAAEPDSPQGRQLGILWGVVSLLSMMLSPLAPYLASASKMFCVFKGLTGIPCPGCGTTRAALALARFDFAEAFVRYPLQSAAWSVFVAGGFVAAGWVLSGRDLPSVPRRLPAWLVAVAVTLAFANWGYCIATGV